MKDDFDNIRAERDVPFSRQQPSTSHAGLWKQIALGIFVGFGALTVIGAVGWVLVAKWLLSSLQVHIP
jgi:hypothetical protein